MDGFNRTHFGVEGDGGEAIVNGKGASQFRVKRFTGDELGIPDKV